MSMSRLPAGQHQQSATLVDLLDRVLDKGLVVAGDISISLANVELLTIRIRLLVCSIDKAEQIGLNWWRNDPTLVGIDLITVEARVVVASIDTYLRYADALGLSPRQATGTLGAGAASVDAATSRARTTQE